MKFYTPILKLKRGEINAIDNLKSDTKNKIRPLFYFDDIPNDNIIEKLPNIFFYDTLGEDGIIDIFNSKINKDVRAIQVVNNSEYFNTNDDICIRLTTDDLDNISILNNINNYNNKSLIIDFNKYDSDTINSNILRYIMKDLERILRKDWEYIAVAGTTAPVSMSNIGIGTSTIDRTEWTVLYKEFLETFDFINYADYTITTPPSITESTYDPRIMNISTKIRYTTDENFLIVKGPSLKRYGGESYYELAKKVIDSGFFKGKDFSYGDNYIYETSLKKHKGNLTTWITVDINHHIELVINQLSNLS